MWLNLRLNFYIPVDRGNLQMSSLPPTGRIDGGVAEFLHFVADPSVAVSIQWVSVDEAQLPNALSQDT